MTHQTTPKTIDNEIADLKAQLDPKQLNFLIARMVYDTDAEAAAAAKIPVNTVKNWNNAGKKRIIDRILQLNALGNYEAAVEIVREYRLRNLPKAITVKVAGLDSRNERVRQATATEIIEGILGKAEQPSRIDGKVELIWNSHQPQPTGKS